MACCSFHCTYCKVIGDDGSRHDADTGPPRRSGRGHRWVAGHRRGVGPPVRALRRGGGRVGARPRSARRRRRIDHLAGRPRRRHPADCTDQDEVDTLRAGTEAAFGPATVLLAFAGGDGRPEPIHNWTPTRWRAVIDTNLTSTYLTVRTFALGMVERRRGSIVTMSSTAGRQPGGASVAYAAAKAGIVMLTRHLAVEFAPHGVRINCIAPSAIETERLVRAHAGAGS